MQKNNPKRITFRLPGKVFKITETAVDKGFQATIMGKRKITIHHNLLHF
jgi:hypothetical protein